MHDPALPIYNGVSEELVKMTEITEQLRRKNLPGAQIAQTTGPQAPSSNGWNLDIAQPLPQP